MDDFVLFSDNKLLLAEWFTAAKKFLKTDLDLNVHENKCKIFAVGAEVPFLGFVFCKDQVRINSASITRFKRRMKRYSQGLLERTVPFRSVHQSVQSWIGHVKHADTYRLRELVLGDIVL